jgi:signal transduction histidine kinase
MRGPALVDLVALFIEAAESVRPPTPAIVLEHPDQLTVRAAPEHLRQLLRELLRTSVQAASNRAEIRLELGARPGCSFLLRDNGTGHAPELSAATRIAEAMGATLSAEPEQGWGCAVSVRLPPVNPDDEAHTAPYTAPSPLR